MLKSARLFIIGVSSFWLSRNIEGRNCDVSMSDPLFIKVLFLLANHIFGQSSKRILDFCSRFWVIGSLCKNGDAIFWLFFILILVVGRGKWWNPCKMFFMTSRLWCKVRAQDAYTWSLNFWWVHLLRSVSVDGLSLHCILQITTEYFLSSF